MVTEQQQELEMGRRSKLFDDYQKSDDLNARRKQRLKINIATTKDVEARTLAWKLCERPDNPAEGCIFFIENFGWTFDPRPQASPHHLPFFLYEYQKDAIRWIIDHIEHGHDGLLEKSRDMGVSWLLFVWVPLWYWLFKDGINILMGSYKQDLVDNRTKDSLFGMIDYAIDSLPKWMLPKGFTKDKHRNERRLVNPVNFNLIAGDTMNPDFGRGTRKTAVLFDELGSWDYARDAWESCGDVTACRIANSTPKGYNYYAQLRNSGMDVLTLHWKLHPLKDDQWYQFEKSRRTEEEVAQELDISYNKSQEGRVYPEWNENNVEFGDFQYDPNLPLYVSWDFGRDDDTSIIWAQPFRNKIRIIDAYHKTGKLIDFFIPFVTGMIPSENYNYNKQELDKIDEHKYWKRGVHFGDPSGRFHNQVTNMTVIDVLRESGIRINFQDQWKEFSKRKTAAKMLIQQGIMLNKNPETEYMHMCIEQAAYPKVRVQGQPEVRSIKPNHDWTSHHRSAFEYLALGLKEFRGERSHPTDKFKNLNVNDRHGRRRGVSY